MKHFIIFIIAAFTIGVSITNFTQESYAQNTITPSNPEAPSYTFEMELEEPNLSIGGLGSDMYEVEDIETNVTDLIGSEIAETMIFPVSASEDQVFLNFDLKVPEEPDSKKSVIEKSSFSMDVISIEEKEKRSKTYELEPQQYSDAVIGEHKVLGGYLDVKGDEGTLLLYLQP